MRLVTLVLLLWFSNIFSEILAQESDEQVAASFEQSGTCAYYFQKPGKQASLADACIKYCDTHGGHGYSECDWSPYKDIDFEHGSYDHSLIRKDAKGDFWVACKCKCENKDVESIAKPLIDLIVEGLSQLDHIICAAMLESFRTIVDVGIDFVPGGASLNAAKNAVEGAKSFAENGLQAADFFGNWANWNFDLWGALTGAPDSYGSSIGCKRKNKSECKKPESKPTGKNKEEPTTTDKNKEKPTTTDTNKEEPTTSGTKKDDSSTSSTATTSTSSSDRCESPTKGQPADACEKTSPCEIQMPDKGDGDTLLSRDGYRSFRRMFLRKRDKKGGKPCAASPNYKDFRLESDEYPPNGKLGDNVAAFGWDKQNNLCDYSWQSGTKRDVASKYDSEHVMEWQIVTDFFAKLNEKGQTKYEHPDPKENKRMVDFCTYWIESWSLEAGQEFAIQDSPRLIPWKHIAAAYPSNKNHKEEMIALQRNINTPAKANLFTDSIPLIWNPSSMGKKVNNDRNKVLERLRLALGAQKYLTEKKVKDIFEAQKTRMGTILDELDEAMETHPREIVDAQNKKTTYYPWKRQNLLTEWNNFMDSKWEQATKKHKKVMNTWTDRLRETHCQSKPKKSTADKEFCDRLEKLEAQYKKVTPFSKPW